VKVARTVLRGESGGNAADLPDGVVNNKILTFEVKKLPPNLANMPGRYQQP
jgi:hypothetical protein